MLTCTYFIQDTEKCYLKVPCQSSCPVNPRNKVPVRLRRFVMNPFTGLYWDGTGFSAKATTQARAIPDSITAEDFMKIFACAVVIHAEFQ